MKRREIINLYSSHMKTFLFKEDIPALPEIRLKDLAFQGNLKSMTYLANALLKNLLGPLDIPAKWMYTF